MEQMEHGNTRSKTKLMVMLLLSMFTAMVFAADYVYVNDELRVGVRPKPSSRSNATSVVITGMRLEVLEKRGNYLRIRTDKGDEGWVKKTYTTTQAPAAVRLKKLQQQLQSQQAPQQDPEENKALRKEISSLNEANSQYRDQILGLTQRLEQASNAPKQQPEQPSATSFAEIRSLGSVLWWLPLAILVSIVVGFFLGAQWFKRYTMRKLGGLNI